MKAAVIGLGGQGRRVVEVLRDLPGIQLVAVVDPRDAALNGVDVSGAARFRSADDLWGSGGADLVCITTTAPSHAPLAHAAMAAGARFLMVEKPMACSAAECDAVIRAAVDAGVRVAVDQGRRHDPAYRWLRDEIQSGRWGEVRCIFIQRPGIGLGCLGTHAFDLAMFLSGRPAESVSAWVDAALGTNPRGKEFVDPGGLVVLGMGPVRAVVAQIEDGSGPMSVEVDLTGARVRVDEKNAQIEVIERDLSVKPGPDRPPVFRVDDRPRALNWRSDLKAMIRGVLTDLIGSGSIDCDGRTGLAAVEILAAAHLSSSRQHVPVALPLTGADRELWLPVT